MLSVKAENGKLILPEGSVKLPVGRKAVIITFLEFLDEVYAAISCICKKSIDLENSLPRPTALFY